MAEEEKKNTEKGPDPALTSANATTSVDARTFTEQLKQETGNLPKPEQGAVVYKTSLKGQENSPVMNATIRSTQSEKKSTTSTTEEYTFASNSVADPETGKLNSNLYVANPEYKKQTVTTESGNNFLKQTIVKHHEYYINSQNGMAKMLTTESQSSRSHQTKGNKTIEQTTEANPSIGKKTDVVYTKKTETRITGTSIPSVKSGKETGSVTVSAQIKGKSFTASVEYEGMPATDGSINYTPVAEYYVVDDAKTGNSYAYKKSADGKISGEEWHNDGSQWTKVKDIELSNQMKKDFAKYQKARDKAIKQATNYKSAQDYMDHTPRRTAIVQQEVNTQQQSINYVAQATEAAKMAILNKAKQRQN